MAYNSPSSIGDIFRRPNGVTPYSLSGLRPINFNVYDLDINRIVATEYYRSLLRLKYGEAYDFVLWGPGVDSLGRLTSEIVDKFNETGYGGFAFFEIPTQANIDTAFSFIEDLVFVTLVKRESPHYEYPWYYEYRIAPYSTVDRFEFNSKQIQNLKYLGSKISGTAINVDSVETSDGGPVVKVSKVNQNQIVFSNNNITTAQANVSGLPIRQLTARTGTSAGSSNIGTGQTTNPPSGGGTSELE